MKVQCIHNTGEGLRQFENKSLKKEELGRFGTTGFTEYGEIELGKEYLVMGMIMFESYLAYLIDDNGFISACPCQLFEKIDSKIGKNWYFRLIEKNEIIYPYIQAIWGYYEFCFDSKSYENLIVDKDYETKLIYFKRKLEFENE